MDDTDSISTPYLYSIRPTRTQRRAAMAVLGLSAVLFLVTAPFAAVQLPEVWGFLPAYQSAYITTTLITAVMLFGQFRMLGARGLLILAGGYLFDALMAVVHALSFPGLFAASGLLGAGPQTTAWIYFLWHGGFPLFVIGYALAHDAKRDSATRAQAGDSALPVIAFVLALVGAITLLGTAGQELLPTIMHGGRDASGKIIVAAVTCILSLAALIALALRRRPSLLDVWLMVSMGGWVFEVTLAAVLNHGRFDFGWYVGRVFGLLAGSTVLIMLLLEHNKLYVQLARSRYAENMRSRAKLQASEAQLRTLFDAMVEGFGLYEVVFDRNGRLSDLKHLMVNPAYERHTGRHMSEVVGKNVSELFPAGEEHWSERCGKVALTGEAEHFEARFGPLGRWYDVNAYRTEPGRIALVFYDITERKNAETQLRVSEEKYRALFSNTTEGFGLGEPVLDADGKAVDLQYLEVNEAFYRHTGMPRGITERRLREHLPQVKQEWIDRYAAVALSGREDQFEMYDADTGRYYDLRAFRPSPGRFAVLFRDVSDRRQAQKALQESRSHLSLALKSVGASAWVWDVASGHVIAVEGDSLYKMLGYTPDELREASDWVSLVHEDDGQGISALLEDLVAGRRDSYMVEIRMRARSGAWCWIVSQGVVAERDEHGTAIRVVGTNTDVTRRKELETRLLQFNSDLERQVKERTAQLVQAQKMEAIGQLTGGVAHDFNNVLQGLSSCLFVFERYLPEGAPRTLFKAAQQSIESGARLTQSLLAFARRQTLTPESVDLAKLFESMRPLLERTLGGMIGIKVDVSPATPPVRVDRGQLESAILNLAINSRDAMPTGGGRLSLRTERVVVPSNTRALPSELEPGDYVAIDVEDTGEGMDEATLAHVFEPFFTTKAFGKGSGLGLSMVHGMVMQSGGSIAISSRPPHGTTVTLYLPSAGSVEPDPADAPAAEMMPGDGGAVLLVDDNELMRNALKMALENLGYRVVDAADGTAALKLLQNGLRIDVLVTDYAMPGMNGIELTRAARELDPTLPVLLVTGYVDKLADVDGVALLRKPFETVELVATLSEMLESRASSDLALP